MFEHRGFRRIRLAEVPLDQDLTIMDIKWAGELEREWLKVFAGKEGSPYKVGHVCALAFRSVTDELAEASWYPNYFDRFHEVPIFVPHNAVIFCVEIPDYDARPYVFVNPSWLAELHERPLVTFAMVDAIGVGNIVRNGTLTSAMLVNLRNKIDKISSDYPDFAFISFADSLLVKKTWSVGHVDSTIKYTYEPEEMFPVVDSLVKAFSSALSLRAYAILTQGMNAYDDATSLHYSDKGNHISLNTLGVPFSQLMAIEASARESIKGGNHPPSELYVDSRLFRSLKFNLEFDKDTFVEHAYSFSLNKAHRSAYVATSLATVLENLRRPDGD